MPDVFISYASMDEKLAHYAHEYLTAQGLEVFMAGISLLPGQRWSEEIRTKLQTSPWVIVLASKAAGRSPFVQQEFGMALSSGKTIVPVVWDQDPRELPGWMGRFQVLDLRGRLLQDVGPRLDAIAERIHEQKQQGVLIIAALVTALLVLGARKG